MTSQESGRRTDQEEDLGASVSSRTVTVCLTVGIALFILILAIPYLNDL